MITISVALTTEIKHKHVHIATAASDQATAKNESPVKKYCAIYFILFGHQISVTFENPTKYKYHILNYWCVTSKRIEFILCASISMVGCVHFWLVGEWHIVVK